MTISRAARRRIAKVQDRVDRITAADAAFFGRRPDRQHRIRLASTAELEQSAAMLEVDDAAPERHARWIVLVKQVEPGARLRAFAQATGFDDLDVSEAEAKALYDEKCPPGSYMHAIEMQLRAALSKAEDR